MKRLSYVTPVLNMSHDGTTYDICAHCGGDLYECFMTATLQVKGENETYYYYFVFFAKNKFIWNLHNNYVSENVIKIVEPLFEKPWATVQGIFPKLAQLP